MLFALKEITVYSFSICCYKLSLFRSHKGRYSLTWKHEGDVEKCPSAKRVWSEERFFFSHCMCVCVCVSGFVELESCSTYVSSAK